ncbi:hypothetical protein PFDG_02349, partial [Plasmodium falciparum Dd2]
VYIYIYIYIYIYLYIYIFIFLYFVSHSELSHEHFVGQSSNTHGASSVTDFNFSEEKNLKSFEGKNNNNDNYASINRLYRKKPYMKRSLINLENDLFRLEPISYIQRYYKKNINRSDIFHNQKERGSKVYSNVSSFHSFIQEEGLKNDIDELNSLISYFKDSQETLIKDDELKKNMKTDYLNNVKYIEENVTHINEIILLKDSITQRIADIDELNSLNLININDFINEKNISQEKTQNICFMKKKSVNELQTILNTSNNECAKLNFMKSDNNNNNNNNSNIINLLKTELSHLLSLKENIIKKLLNHIEQNIQNSSNKYTITYTDINNRMEDYKEEIESLEVYKHTIGNIQKEYILHLYENDKNALAVHNTSMQILQYKDAIQNIKNKISDDIKILKKYKEMNQDLLNYYEILDKKLKDNTYINKKCILLL